MHTGERKGTRGLTLSSNKSWQSQQGNRSRSEARHDEADMSLKSVNSSWQRDTKGLDRLSAGLTKSPRGKPFTSNSQVNP
eukprot:8106325-Pyramimonas_sp.AAC.1